MGYTEKWRLNARDLCDHCEIECEDLIETINEEFLCSGCDSKRLINEQ